MTSAPVPIGPAFEANVGMQTMPGEGYTRGMLGFLGDVPLVQHAYKGWRTLANMTGTFDRELYVRAVNSESRIAQLGVVAMGGAAVAGQALDRFRIPESINIPNAISLAENHGNIVGAAGLGIGVYLGQYAIGAAWGLGLKRFPHTAQEFDRSYPKFKEELAEENAGYAKTLWRQSVAGIGIGNTAFMTAEVLQQGETISDEKILETANKTSRRIGAAVGVLGFGLLEAGQRYIDKSVGIPNVFDVEVATLIERAKDWKTWVIVGFGLDYGPKIVGYGIKNGVKAGKSIVNFPIRQFSEFRAQRREEALRRSG